MGGRTNIMFFSPAPRDVLHVPVSRPRLCSRPCELKSPFVLINVTVATGELTNQLPSDCSGCEG